MKQALIIFVKNLEKGKVKTRLAKEVGDNEALAIYTRLVAHTHKITIDLQMDKYVFYSDYIEVNDIWNNGQYIKHVQEGSGLGERMEEAFSFIAGKGHDQIVIIGSDCLDLHPNLIREAYHELKHHDIILGPAADGGYYLLGMKARHPQLFQGIDWSTDNVFRQTMDICNSNNLSVYQLQTLNDIDTAEDWQRAIQHNE